MARLACETKMGFYPTDIKTIQKVIDKTLLLPEAKQGRVYIFPIWVWCYVNFSISKKSN